MTIARERREILDRSRFSLLVSAALTVLALTLGCGQDYPHGATSEPASDAALADKAGYIPLATAVRVSGDVAYVGMGTSVIAVDIRDLANPQRIGSVRFEPAMRSSQTSWRANEVIDMAVHGNYVLAAFRPWIRSSDEPKRSIVVFDFTNPTEPEFLTSFDTPGDFVRGIDVSGDRAYVRDESALHVIDVSDPRGLKIIGSCPSEHVTLPSARAVWDGPKVVGTVSMARRPVVASDGNVLVAAGKLGLEVYNVSVPESPVLLAALGNLGDATSVTLAKAHAYVTSNANMLHVIDIADRAKPVDVASQVVFEHANAGAIGIATSGSIALVYDVAWPGGRRNDGTPVPRSGGLQVYDLADAASPECMHPVQGKDPTIDGPILDIDIQGSTALVGVADRLVIVDVSSPRDPRQLGNLHLSP